MKRKARRFLYAVTAFLVTLLGVTALNQLLAFSRWLGSLHPDAPGWFGVATALLAALVVVTGYRFFTYPRRPRLPQDEHGASLPLLLSWMQRRIPVHHAHPDPAKNGRDLRWHRTNLKLLDSDAQETIREIATKNFFVGAFAQNTAYGTTTSLLNNIRLVWNIYIMHHGEQYVGEFIALLRSVYESLPLSDFRKEDIPDHIRPVIQASFSNTLSSLLPGGNLLTPFFMNLFIAGSTNAYLSCLTGIIATRHCHCITAEDQAEILRQSMFEASFMLKEIVRECNPVLSVTISNAVRKGGRDTLDTMQGGTQGSGTGSVAQDIVSHLASSLKSILKEKENE